MANVKEYVGLYWKQWLVALSILGISVLFLLALGGCSTISGIAEDVGSMSEATRKAMTK